MLFENSEGGMSAGTHDLIGVVQDTSTQRFHAFVWEEKPPPGPYDPNAGFVRLKSKLHHTAGEETFEGALQQVKKLREKIKIDDQNVWIEPAQVMLRDFSTEGYADVLVIPSWRKPSEAQGQGGASGV